MIATFKVAIIIPFCFSSIFLIHDLLVGLIGLVLNREDISRI